VRARGLQRGHTRRVAGRRIEAPSKKLRAEKSKLFALSIFPRGGFHVLYAPYEFYRYGGSHD